jgi:hypothetical protein
MRTSTERILTTHVGSLPRSQAVTDVLFGREHGTVTDVEAAARIIADATEEVVRRQVAAGVDVVSDGEMSKISYATYVADRFTGFAGDTPRDPGQDLVEFPRLLEKLAKLGSTAKYRRPRCVGEIRTRTLEPLHEDLRASPPMPSSTPLHLASSRCSNPMISIRLPTTTWRPWPRPCAWNTRPSSRPDSWCRSTRRISAWAATRCTGTPASTNTWRAPRGTWKC